MPERPLNAADVAERLAVELERRNVDYAVGGAIALGYWAQPRGTVDVDITLFLPHDKYAECIGLLSELGCKFDSKKISETLNEHGFCQVSYQSVRVDVFLPIADFYHSAKERRKRVFLGDQQIWIWDAETLAVFKLMFFRRKDFVDVEQMLRIQGKEFDSAWARKRLEEIYGRRDPRLAAWDELVADQS